METFQAMDAGLPLGSRGGLAKRVRGPWDWTRGASPGPTVLVAMITTVRPVIERIERRDRDLGRQLRRSAASVVSNLGEGNRRMGGDRLQLWRVCTAGSAEEAKVQLRIARAWGYCAGAKLDDSDVAVDRMCALLYRLTTPRP